MAWLPNRAKWACPVSIQSWTLRVLYVLFECYLIFCKRFQLSALFLSVLNEKKKDLNVNIFLNWIQLGQSRGRQRVPLSLRKPIHEERGQEQRWLKNNERFMMKSRGLGVRSCPGLFAALHFKSIHFLCNPHGCKAHALSHTGGLTHLPIYDVVNLHDVSAGNWLHDEEEDGGIKWGYECKIIARSLILGGENVTI